MIQPAHEAFERITKKDREVKDLEAIANDKDENEELVELAASELAELKTELKDLEKNSLQHLIEKDVDSSRNAILEVRAGEYLLDIILFLLSECMSSLRDSWTLLWKYTCFANYFRC